MIISIVCNCIIKKKFPTLFDQNYECVIKDHVAEIVLDTTATPIFHGAYTVPYGLVEKVEKELDRLISNGIIVPVRYSDWSSPICVVKKKRWFY